MTTLGATCGKNTKPVHDTNVSASMVSVATTAPSGEVTSARNVRRCEDRLSVRLARLMQAPEPVDQRRVRGLRLEKQRRTSS